MSVSPQGGTLWSLPWPLIPGPFWGRGYPLARPVARGVGTPGPDLGVAPLPDRTRIGLGDTHPLDKTGPGVPPTPPQDRRNACCGHAGGLSCLLKCAR